MRHPILYADMVWRRQRFFVFILVGFSAAMFVSQLLAGSRQGGLRITSTLLFYLLYAAIAFVLFAGFQLNRRRSYVEVTPAGLKVSRLLRNSVIDWDHVRGARVQPLRTVTQDLSRRAITPAMKDLLDHPALLVRLGGEPEEVAQVSRNLRSSLGTRLLFDSTLALPVKDAEGALREMTPHVPVRAQVNLGGAKRSKRRR